MKRSALCLCLSLVACGDEPHGTSGGSPRINAITRDLALSARCRVRDVLADRVTLAAREAPLAVGGLDAPYWLTTMWFVNEQGKSPNTLGLIDAFDAFGVGRWLSFSRGTLSIHDRPTEAGRAVRTITNACNVQILGVQGGAWVVYRRGAQGCFGDASSGPLFVLRVTENGQRVDSFSPLADTPIRSVSARMDSGRIVLTTQSRSERAPRSTVLDLDGTLLLQREGGSMICPLTGCLFISVARGVVVFRSIDGGPADFESPSEGQPSSGVLFSVSVGSGSLRAIAVNGTRALLATQQDNSTRHSLFMVDVAARRVETVFDSRVRAGVDVWREDAAASTMRVAATSTGFAYVASGSAGELIAREVQCEP
jgi:hypothetical protein